MLNCFKDFIIYILEHFALKNQTRKILNYIKSLCIIFCVKIFYYSQYIYYSQKELKHVGLEISLVYGVLEYFSNIYLRTKCLKKIGKEKF